MQPDLKCTFIEENISLVIKSNSTTKGRVLILTELKKGKGGALHLNKWDGGGGTQWDKNGKSQSCEDMMITDVIMVIIARELSVINVTYIPHWEGHWHWTLCRAPLRCNHSRTHVGTAILRRPSICVWRSTSLYNSQHTMSSYDQLEYQIRTSLCNIHSVTITWLKYCKYGVKPETINQLNPFLLWILRRKKECQMHHFAIRTSIPYLAFKIWMTQFWFDHIEYIYRLHFVFENIEAMMADKFFLWSKWQLIYCISRNFRKDLIIGIINKGFQLTKIEYH